MLDSVLGGDYMIPVDRDEILSRFAVMPAVLLKVFINYIFRLHVKSFIPVRSDPSFVLPGSRFVGTKKLINTFVWKYPW